MNDPGMVRGWQPFLNAKVMDVGANVGLWTAYCALHGANVTAYEADPVTFAILKERTKDWPVQVVNSAVWTFTGYVFFRGFTSGESHNGALAHINCPDNGLFRETEIIPCVSFDSVIGAEKWDCVKLDVEGAEFEILIAASDESLRQIDFMYVETHPWWVDSSLPARLLEKLRPIFQIEEYPDYLCLHKK
jgi:FkbM family methyltransferase